MKQYSILLFSIFLVQTAVCLEDASTPCRDHEVYDLKKCYRFFNDPSNFLTADSYCRMYGYTLASIHSMFENNFIQKQAGLSLSMTYQSFFIGLYSSSMKTENYNWTWTDETPYDFWNWLPGDPTGSRWCATMRISDGKWETTSCDSKLPFVCSAPPGNPGNVTTNPTSTTQLRTTTT